MKKIIIFLLTTIVSYLNIAFAQGLETLELSGTVTDAQGVPLPGADVMIKGTSIGTVTNFDGNFKIESPETEGLLMISYVGFISQELPFNTNTINFTIALKDSALGLSEVMIVASTAVDRKTPVAVSTVRKEEIELKLGNQEFVEILKSTPGVYTTREGGGFGDSEVLMRGFESENVAVLINGIPVNDMENGRVFWSNWAGLGNYTSSVQTQRGLGAAKVAVPSIGGTINTITETTDAEEGGKVLFGVGNDGYTKYGLKYSTGLIKDKFAVTVYADRTYGDGYVDGTPFNSVSYFANISYQINEKHKLAFNALGAKQEHGQRRALRNINVYRRSERGIRFNGDWGYQNGQFTSIRDNFFHKPQISLNHYWDINDVTKLSTSLYYSSGTGGGGTDEGEEEGKLIDRVPNESYRVGNLGPIDLDRIVRENAANENGSTAILANNINNHVWIGGISTLNAKFGENFSFTGGLDARYYRGEHFREVKDLLGGSFYLDDNNINTGEIRAQVGDKITFNNDGIVDWLGSFAQLEYDNEFLSAFVAGNLSNTGYQRVDFFDKLNSDPEQTTDRQTFLAYGLKAGANFRLNDFHNVFFNVGGFERAPFFRDVWLNFDNDRLNENVKNQEIISFELGYGLRTEKLAANINIYRTEWNNRNESFTDQVPERDENNNPIPGTTEFIFANASGVDALHQGVEFDIKYKPFKFLTFTGMLSVGDWNWTNNVKDIPFFNDEQEFRGIAGNLFLKDVPVGRSAQTTSALGVKYDITPKTIFAIDYTYADRYYSSFRPRDRTVENAPEPWQIPDFGLFDAMFKHSFNFGSFEASVTARMYNVFNTEFINRSQDGSGTAEGATVFFGPGRTFNIGTVVNF